MSYQVFARKYRPLTFDDVLGQDHVVRTLKNAIEQKRLAHAYLFVGPRGTGKTSTARIFAKALNCPDGPKVDFDPNDPVCQEIAEGRSLDVLEIDGASNNGVEQVRDLRDNVQFAPSSGQFRIFYIDEVHMLSKPAFNALLKTLEEPPPHVKFIFATTEAHKILPTILSRCQRFDLRPIGTETIAKHLLYIAAQEGVTLAPEAAYAVAKAADGGMRDAQSMLDQLVSFCGTNIRESDVLDIFGITSRETVGEVICYMLAKQISPLLQKMNDQAESGRDLMQFLGEMIFGLREVLVSKVDPSVKMEGISDSLSSSIEKSTTRLDTSKLLRVIEILAETEERMKWATNKRLHMEIGLIKAVHSLTEANISDIIRALDGAPLVEIKAAQEPSPVAIATPATITPPAAQVQESPAPQETDSTPSSPEADPEPTPAPPAPAPEPTPATITPPAAQVQESPAPQETDSSPSSPEADPEPAPAPPAPAPETIPAPAPQDPAPNHVQETPDTYEAEKKSDEQSIPAAPLSPAPLPSGDLFDDISEPPAAAAPIQFIDNAPVRPPEPDEEDDAEAPTPVDENTAPLFSDLTEPPPEEVRETISASAQLWTAFLADIQDKMPIKFLSIEHTPFLRVDGIKFVVGVHPNDLMARDILLSSEMKSKIEEFLHDHAGQTLSFSVETTEEAPMPVEEELEPLPLPIPKPLPPREPKPSAEEIKAKEQALAAEREEAKAKAMEEFYNDPLIQEALDIFQAKIIH